MLANCFADGRGIIVPFADANAIGTEIEKLLINAPLRQAMRKALMPAAAYMTGERTAERYMSVFRERGSPPPAQDHCKVGYEYAPAR